VPGFVRERFLRRSRQLLPHEPVQQVDRLDRADHHLDMRDPVYLLTLTDRTGPRSPTLAGTWLRSEVLVPTLS